MLFGSHFNKAFKLTIGHEGGYVNDSTDKGGETKYGISKRAFPDIDIASLTLDGAKEIYRQHYYDYVYDYFEKDIALELFDTGVNMGVLTAKKMLQESLNVLNRNQKIFDDLVIDGILGKKTIEAYDKINKKKLLKSLNGMQFAKYYAIVQHDPTQEKYFNGWLNRV